MKNCRLTAKIRAASAAGFTLVELVTVITVFGILAALTITSWNGFMTYQGAKEEALAFQKDLLALRGLAMDRGDSLISITFSTPANGNHSYTVRAIQRDPVTNAIDSVVVKTVNLNRTKVIRPAKTGNLPNGLGVSSTQNLTRGCALDSMPATAISTTNDWTGRIRVNPTGVEVFLDSTGSSPDLGRNNRSAWIVFRAGDDYFCVLKARGSNKPQLFHKKQKGSTNGTWKRI